jgi:hypothetical protein
LNTQFPTYQLPFIKEDILFHEDQEDHQDEFMGALQQYLTDLSRIPFVRENNVFKNFLQMDAHYTDDDFENRRMFQTMGPSMFQSSMNPSQPSGRSSVLNPFNKNHSASSSAIVMVTNAKQNDGRKSVHPRMSGAKQESLSP